MPAWPACSAPTPGIRAGRVDERQDRVAEAVGQLDRADRLAVALGPGHAEVAVRALRQVAALLVADERHRPAVVGGDAGHDRRVVAGRAVAVQLVGVAEQALRVVERVRPVLVPRVLHDVPDLRLLAALLEAPAKAPDVLGDPNHPTRAPAVGGASRTRPRPPARAARRSPVSSGGGANSASSRASVAVSSPRGTTASMWPSRSCDSARPKSVGQRLARRLLHDARAGERHQRARLGDRDVAERRERGDHAAGGRVRRRSR